MTLAALAVGVVILGASAPWTSARCDLGVLSAYAHNDYQHARPLADALAAGYRGVEVDVFLVDGQLRLGHDRNEAKRSGTLADVYLSPLDRRFARCAPHTAGAPRFLLNIELKEAARPAFDSLLALLSRYPVFVESMLDGDSTASPIEVVLVGWHPPLETWSSDARQRMGAQYAIRRLHDASMERELLTLDPTVRLLSLDYGKTIGRWWRTAAQRRAWFETLRTIRRVVPDRRIRVYNVPTDAAIYQALLAAGVDLIGTKDLTASREALAPRSPP